VRCTQTGGGTKISRLIERRQRDVIDRILRHCGPSRRSTCRGTPAIWWCKTPTPRRRSWPWGRPTLPSRRAAQELTDQATEADRRLLLREEMKLRNVKLAGAAKDAGVVEPVDYAIFQNHGYMGLYGGLDMRSVHRRKGLKKSQQILDHRLNQRKYTPPKRTCELTTCDSLPASGHGAVPPDKPQAGGTDWTTASVRLGSTV
jgi:hypothetical protein